MITRNEVARMAREAGFEVHDRKQQVRVGLDALAGIDSTEKLERFAALVAAHVIARQRPPPLVLNVSDADLSELKAWLVNAPNMPLVSIPDDTALECERAARIAAQSELTELKERLALAGIEQRRAVLAEREACAKVVESSPSYDWHRFACETAYAIRSRGAA